MSILKRKRKDDKGAASVQLGRRSLQSPPFKYHSFGTPELELYDALRDTIPIIDAAISKTVRLIGGFKAECSSKEATDELNSFLREVRVGPSSYGITAFLTAYLDSLLTYGTAAGEIVPDVNGGSIAALYVADIKSLEFEKGKNPLDVNIYVRDKFGEHRKVPNPGLVMLTALNPEPGEVTGRSILRGLPFVSSILVKIFNSIGINWDRMGNARFAVTCKNSDSSDLTSAGDRAAQIAEAWQSAMSDSSEVRDFVAVGDVDIKVIGADNPVLDSSVPVQQLLEQIVAKTGLPPFMLGLSWSSTERMSSQQADILTSELDYYRIIVEPVLLKICRIWLALGGYGGTAKIVWDNINLQDEVELAKAELYRAQAKQLGTGGNNDE